MFKTKENIFPEYISNLFNIKKKKSRNTRGSQTDFSVSTLVSKYRAKSTKANGIKEWNK